MRFIPSAELQAYERQPALERQNEPVMTGLAGHLQMLWEEAKEAKEPITRDLLANLRQRKGEYEPQKLAQIQATGGSTIFILLTDAKCRHASALLQDVLLPESDRAWDLSPTPVPDLPSWLKEKAVMRLQQEAMAVFEATGAPVPEEQLLARAYELRDELMAQWQDIADQYTSRMETMMDDQLEEGGWRIEMRDFIDDLVTFQSSFFKGPVIRRRKKLTWDITDFGGRRMVKPLIERKIVKTWERRSPFDIYPSPNARGINDGYLFDRYRHTLGDLESMKGVPGYDEQAINEIIDEYGQSGFREWITQDYERARVENRPYEYLNQARTIECHNFWGSVHGQLLLDWGMSEEQVRDPRKVYEIEAWKCGRWVFKATLNPHPLGHRPYSKSSFDKVPGSFWGKGVPNLMKDDQQMCNAAGRAISNNAGIASGPQVVINDSQRLPPGEKVTSLHPWKIWVFGGDRAATSHRPPIDFFQPNPMVRELLEIFKFFMALADMTTGIPAYSHGGAMEAKGALETASGFSMAIGQTSKGAKQVVRNVDIDIVEPRLRDLYVHNMMFEDDPNIKGDSQVRARGSMVLMQKEQQQVRRREFLDGTNNPTDLQIMGLDGRAAVLREVAKSLEMPIDKIVPDPEKMKRLMQMMRSSQVQAPNTGTPENASQTLDASGAPVAGQDTRLFNEPSRARTAPSSQTQRG